MSTQFGESINFLIKEFNRLKLKEKNKNLSDQEKETLKKLKMFH